MGLLDAFNTDDGMQALGLLSAAAPSLTPTNLAGRLAQAGDTYRQLQTDQLKRQDLAQQLQIRNIELQRAQQQWEALKPVYDMIGRSLSGQAATAAPSQPAIEPSPGGSLGSGTFGIPTGGQTSSAPASAGGGNIFGMPASQAGVTLALGGPAELAKAVTSYNSPTDFSKMLMAAGIDPNSPIGRSMIQGNLAKQNYVAPVNARPGSILRDPFDPSKVVAFNPHVPEGTMPRFDANGNVIEYQPIGNAEAAIGLGERAKTFGKAQATPSVVYVNGKPQFSTVAQDVQRATGSLPPPQAGASLTPGFDLNAPGLEAAIAKLPPQDQANVREAIRMQQSLPRSESVITPAQAPGFEKSQEKLAGANADRYNSLITQSSDSPTRVNVFDNILNLSKQGVTTGPGQEWINAVKGFAANTPLLKNVTGNWKDDVSGFQELNKFLYQNAQRAWQAAGGTGTDAQLESFTRANPNSKMFPQALQAMAEWGKAGELALQGKANAAQAWKDQQGGNVANMDQFERTWRNNFDPVLFQLKTMDPARQQAYVDNLKRTNPSAYTSLMMKATALKNIGGL
jgi:hypothetical protein